MTALRNSLSNNEATGLNSICDSWIRKDASSTNSQGEIIAAVNQLYALMNLDAPAVFWCQSPWHAMVMPIIVETLLRFTTRVNLQIYLRSKLRKDLDQQYNVQWRAIWCAAHKQLEMSLAADKWSFKRGASPYGADLNDAFQKRPGRARRKFKN